MNQILHHFLIALAGAASLMVTLLTLDSIARNSSKSTIVTLAAIAAGELFVMILILQQPWHTTS